MEQAMENLSKQELQEQIISLQQTLGSKQQEIEAYRQLVAKLQRMLFGSKRERFVHSPVPDNQLSLCFDELAKKDPEATDKPVKEIITYTREKKSNHKGRKPLPNHLEEKEIILEPEENTEGLTKIGEERTEILEYTPANFYKLVIVRPKYAKQNQEGVLIAPMPSRPIEKCLAGNMLLCQILINKYCDHLPLYRQLEIFKRASIDIASSTIGGWIEQLGALLTPLYNAMVATLKNDGYLQADETPTRVLDKQKKGKTHKGYYWVYHSPLKKMVVFDYQRGRNSMAPRSMLQNFDGFLQTDGYKVYQQYAAKPTITHLACWAHARRYYEQALDQDKARANYALEKIQELYAIEREIKNASPEDRKEQRLQKSLPIINQLGKWISTQNKEVLPTSLIGKAFTYSINLWDNLQHYLFNGNLLIDNNLIENSIRPNALGRKNYLFAGSDEAAQRSAMFYTFIGTCKLNGVNPQEWLYHVLNKIADHKANKLYQLFPGNLNITDNNSSM